MDAVGVGLPGTVLRACVLEALRLWPVAWFLARRPARPHAIAGVTVTPEDDVIVCPYAVHRNPRHWEDPHAYRPERWAADRDPRAFIPFGWGPHRCIAGTLSMQGLECLGMPILPLPDEVLILLDLAAFECARGGMASAARTAGDTKQLVRRRESRRGPQQASGQRILNDSYLAAHESLP